VGSGYIDPRFVDFDVSWKLSGQIHAPTALTP
jgi:hypothetical protein